VDDGPNSGNKVAFSDQFVGEVWGVPIHLNLNPARR